MNFLYSTVNVSFWHCAILTIQSTKCCLMLKVCIKCWLWALLKVRLFFTSLNDVLPMVSRSDILQLATAVSRTHIKGCFLKKYWTSLKFNRLYKSGHVRNAVRSLSDYWKPQSLYFLIEMPQHFTNGFWLNSGDFMHFWDGRSSQHGTCTLRKPHYCYFPHSIFALGNNLKSEQSNLQLVIIMNILDK